MSRVKRKKAEKKSRLYIKICMIAMFILLVCGLIAVDYEIREMLAIDESALIGYKRLESEKHIVHVMGENHLVDTEILRAQIYNRFAEFEEIAYNIKEDLVEYLNQILQQ